MTSATKTTYPRPAAFSTPTDRTIRVERVFDAARDRVWQAMTDPALIAQWWGPNAKTLVVEKHDFVRGGHWRYVEHGAKGADGFEGRYREIVPNERFVQTFEWDGMPGHVAIQTFELEDLGDGRTRLVTTVLLHTTEERDGFLHSGMEPGLNRAYMQLDALLEKDA